MLKPINIVLYFLLISSCYGKSGRLGGKDDTTLRLEAMTNIIVYGMVYFIDNNLVSSFNDTHDDEIKVVCSYINMEIVDILWLPYPINIFINKTSFNKTDINRQWKMLSKKISNSPVTEYNKLYGKVLHIKNYNKEEWNDFILVCIFQNSNYINLLNLTIKLIKEYNGNKKLFNEYFEKLLQEWYFSGRLNFVLAVGNQKNLKKLKENLKIKIINDSTTTPVTTLETLQPTNFSEVLYEAQNEEDESKLFGNVRIGGILVLMVCIFGLISLCILNEYQYRKAKKKIILLRSDQEKNVRN